jgi:hypothetical protein
MKKYIGTIIFEIDEDRNIELAVESSLGEYGIYATLESYSEYDDE